VLLCKITVQHWQHCQLSCKSSSNRQWQQLKVQLRKENERETEFYSHISLSISLLSSPSQFNSQSNITRQSGKVASLSVCGWGINPIYLFPLNSHLSLSLSLSSCYILIYLHSHIFKAVWPTGRMLNMRYDFN